MFRHNLQAGDLLTASADDQAHHVVGHHHLDQ